MARVEQEIREIDVVALKEPMGKWPAGTEATVVDDLGQDKIIEISNERGEALDLPVVPVTNLVLIEKYS
ncbi:MAG TPA: hypothetical protein VFM51_02965 [Solirubrobacterales bacterium]|nr:hypothetical protein [Solirubrobacterales bacterium]